MTRIKIKYDLCAAEFKHLGSESTATVSSFSEFESGVGLTLNWCGVRLGQDGFGWAGVFKC